MNESPDTNDKKKIPLHIQILIALIIGTVIGLLINPGEIPISDPIRGTLVPGDGESIVLTETGESGTVYFQKTLDSVDRLKRGFPSLAEEWTGEPLEFEVTEPSIYIVEEPTQIIVRYARNQSQRSAVSSFSAASASELPFQWKPLYEEHGGGTGRKLTAASKYVGDLFLRLLKMITIPLIVSSLVTGVAGLGETSRFGRMFGRTLLYYFSTSVLAITTGILMVNLINPGVGAVLPGGGEMVAGENESLSGVFLGLLNNMIPSNPVQSLAAGDFLSIITFSILFGVFIIFTGGKSAETLRSFFQSFFDVMMNLTMAIIALAPIGVLAFMVYATSTQGLEIFQTLAWYMLAVALALLVHAVVILPLLVKFVGKRSPLEFARAMSPALMTAFSTASSNATLPLTMTSVEKRAGVSNQTSSFVLPLGATINMDGTALYEAVAVLFIAQAMPGSELGLAQQVMVAITALLASVGAAGIPHAGLVMMAIVLQAVGLPLEAQGIIIAVDRVLDMGRTAVNVWSDSCGCAIVDRFADTGEVEAPAVSPEAA
ncbi:MAG: dicarboxylate/amino acid:cation symporter [Planctomycetaceae bacterium]|nr:dicarboxylate/amino acid:cation symporter [Planctomycetaceae bacterium]